MNKFILAALPFALFSANAYGNYYFSLGAGFVFPNSKSNFTTANSNTVISGPNAFQLHNIHWKLRYKMGGEASFAFGYQCGKHWTWRADGEFLYQHFTRRTSGDYGWRETTQGQAGTLLVQNFGNPIDPKRRKINVYSLLANGYYDFSCFNCWVPTLGGGLGIAWIHSPSGVQNNTLFTTAPVNPVAPIVQRSPSYHSTAFAYQFKVGVKREINNCSNVAIQYRFFATTKFRAGGSSFTTNAGTTAPITFTVPKHRVGGLINHMIEVVFAFQL